jgi:transposase
VRALAGLWPWGGGEIEMPAGAKLLLLPQRAYVPTGTLRRAANSPVRAIPPKRNRTEALCFSPYLYRARNLVERFFNKIKHCRRVATRYDKLAANYLAFIQLASIRLWLRINEFTT